MFTSKNFDNNSSLDNAHFSSQVQLGREIQESLQNIRKSFLYDPSGDLYFKYVENLELNLTPYIVQDEIKEGDRCYLYKLGRFIFKLCEQIRLTLKQPELSNGEAYDIILKDSFYSQKLAKKKHAELMLLLARNGLLPIPLGPDFIDMNIQFEKYDPNNPADIPNDSIKKEDDTTKPETSYASTA